MDHWFGSRWETATSAGRRGEMRHPTFTECDWAAGMIWGAACQDRRQVFTGNWDLYYLPKSCLSAIWLSNPGYRNRLFKMQFYLILDSSSSRISTYSMLLTPEKRGDFWFLSNFPINMSAFWSWSHSLERKSDSLQNCTILARIQWKGSKWLQLDSPTITN